VAFIGIDREIENHWIYQDAEYFKVWFEILLRARFSNEPEKRLIEGKLVTIEYGQFIFGRVSWSKRLKVSEQRLRTLFKKLVDDGMIELIQKFPKFSLYSVKNYAKYNQQSNHQREQLYQGFYDTTNHHSNSESTSSQPAANQQLTTQEQCIQRNNVLNKYSTTTTPTNNAFRVFEQEGFGLLSSSNADRLGEFIDVYGDEWVIMALKEASYHGKRILPYVKSILERWRTTGVDEPWKLDKPQKQQKQPRTTRQQEKPQMTVVENGTQDIPPPEEIEKMRELVRKLKDKDKPA
jgi:DnaD/phage-associated family protein